MRARADKMIAVDAVTLRAIRMAAARPSESNNAVLRRLLGLPPWTTQRGGWHWRKKKRPK